MFTGLVEALGTIQEVSDSAPGNEFLIAAARLAEELAIGDSIAVSGACLTVVARKAEAFVVQAGPETLARTNLGELTPKDIVNLERALRVGDRFGGHWVQGHVDGTGLITKRTRQADWETVWFSAPPNLLSHMAPKGSVAVDGVSLTLVDVTSSGFSVALIPHTIVSTTLGKKKVGQSVNLETDILAKYVEKQLRAAGLIPSSG
jgi:riboflavin synthase